MLYYLVGCMPVIVQSLCNILRKHWSSILEDGGILIILEFQGKENIGVYGVRPCAVLKYLSAYNLYRAE